MNRLARLISFFGAVLIVFGATAGSTAHATCDPANLFLPQALYPVGDYSLFIGKGDFNGDGVTDLAVANYNSGTVAVLLGAGSGGVGNGTFLPTTNYPAGSGPRSWIAGDFNEDGITDLAVVDLDSGRISILTGQGSGGVGNGTFSVPVSFDAGPDPRFITTGDFNEDGIADLAVGNGAVNRVSILFGQGSGGVGNGSFGAPVSYPVGNDPWGIVSADFNEDGILDLATANILGGTVSILLGKGSGGVGDGTFAPHVDYFVGASAPNLLTADLNGDGILDLAVTDHTLNRVAILFGHGAAGVGDGTFAAPTTFGVGGSPENLTLGDFNQDGLTDLATADIASDRISVLLGGGTGGVNDGTFSGPFAYPAGDAAGGIVTGDFNGDGHSDLAVSNIFGNTVSVFLSQCTAPPPPPHHEPTLTDVRDVPNDQGGKVFVTWLRSDLDVAPNQIITGYRVWRRIMPGLAAETASASAGAGPALTVRAIRTTNKDGTVDVTYWEALITLPAERLEGYGYTAPTTQDSMAGGNPYTAFFVSALTGDPFTFYESNVDSGYSVDNLAPGQPSPFVGVYGPAGVALHWGVNTESDFATYRLFRGSIQNFPPSPNNLIATLPDTGFVDPSGTLNNFYKLVAFDIHGNASAAALVAPQGPTPVLVSRVGVDVAPGHVSVTWQLGPGADDVASVYRSTDGTRWTLRGEVTADANRRITFDETDVVTGHVGYRLGVRVSGQEQVADEVWADVPSMRLAIQGISPNPAIDRVAVIFTLPRAGAATMDLLDVTGRRVSSQEVGALGAGVHTLDLSGGRALAPGIYWVRLKQGAAFATTRASVIR